MLLKQDGRADVRPEGGALEMTPSRPRVHRLAVASDHSLISEAVCAALSSHGFEVTSVSWPGVPGVALPRARAPLPDAGLLLCELEPPRRLRTALSVVELLPTQWLLLTGAPQGPLWGAMVEAGVETILSSSTTLDELVLVLDGLPRERDVLPIRLRQDLHQSWQTYRSEQETLMARMGSLTPRERSVLGLLYAGDSVRTIAELYEVSEATVRSQVRAVLRKLNVNSQLAAVAAYASFREDAIDAYSDRSTSIL